MEEKSEMSFEEDLTFMHLLAAQAPLLQFHNENLLSRARDPQPIRATDQVVGIIGHGRGSVIGWKLAR